MLSKIKIISILVIMLGVTILMPGTVISKNPIKAADEADPFTVLEIIPYKGMSELSYLVGGQELIDKTMMSINSAADDLAFLNGAISVYPSYEEKAFTGSLETGFREGRTKYSQLNNDIFYFRQSLFLGDYDKEDYYYYVPQGEGTHKATLKENASLADTYSITGTIYDRRNVIAYFAHKDMAGVTFFNNLLYEPYSVTECSTDNPGDYDYSLETNRFILNKGNGKYDVRFIIKKDGGNSENAYRMLNNYQIVGDQTGIYTVEPDSIIYSAYTGGDYKKDTGFVYKGRFKGDYVKGIWGLEVIGEYGSVIDEKYTQYQFKYNVELINNEFFRRDIVKDILSISTPEALDYPVEVIQLTPEMLNEDANKHYINDADYIYINGNYSQHPNYILLYEKYSQEGFNLPSNRKYANNPQAKKRDLNFALHDISWDNTINIFNKAVGIDMISKPVIIHASIYNHALMDKESDTDSPYNFLKEKVSISDTHTKKTGTMCNVAKLYLMLNWGDPIEFNNTFLKEAAEPRVTEITTAINKSSSTGSYVRIDSVDQSSTSDVALYWNSYTFIPEERDVTEDPEDGGTEGSNNRDFYRVLNINPTADFTASMDKIKAILNYVDTRANIIPNKEIQIVNMTSTQFNGSTKDIVTRYDMIYLGDGVGRFNISGRKTNFNDDGMDDKFFFTEGDSIKAYVNSTLEDYRYRGNDLTFNKTQELKAFLEAGYPIVADTDILDLFMNKNSILNFESFVANYNINNNSAYGKGDPFIFNDSIFFNSNNNQKNRWCDELQNHIHRTRPILTLIEPIVYIGTRYYTYVDTNGLLTVKFKLESEASNQRYNASFFIDINGDGLFDEFERVSNEDMEGLDNLTGIKASNIPYVIQCDMSNMHGVFQWKLLVEPETEGLDNILVNRRSELTGYVANNNSKSLKILHIIDDNNDYNLQQSINDSDSIIYEYAKRSLNDYELTFVTMTVDNFMDLYSGTNNAYDHNRPVDTNKLSDYHLIILDNQVKPINNNNGALDNIKDEIDNKLGVIFTKNALSFDNQSSYFSNANYLSFTGKKHLTYNRINRYAPPSYTERILWVVPRTIYQLYIYRNLDTNGSSDLNIDNIYKTQYLTKTNEGDITRYPYEIGKAIMTVDNSYSDYALYDFEPTSGKKVIGWYTLSDGKSPVVREVFNDTTFSGNLYEGMYSSSPNDVKNNYYLFSNGLSFYSGIELERAAVSGNDDEIKLFVNTIITAYKASGRIISALPKIEIKKPVPDNDPVLGASITLLPGNPNIINDEFILFFEIRNSSSDMDLSIYLSPEDHVGDLVEPVGSWDDIIYKSDIRYMVGTEINIGNTDKVVKKGIYALKVPMDLLQGKNNLIFDVVNKEGQTAVYEVLINYIQPPVVTIEAPVPMLNHESKQFIYVDIDFLTIDLGEAGLVNAEALEITLKVDNAMSDVLLNFVIDGVPDDEVINYFKVYRLIDGVKYKINNLEELYPGEESLYLLEVDLSLMSGSISRNISISATDTWGYSGETSVTLLRRTLFPYD